MTANGYPVDRASWGKLRLLKQAIKGPADRTNGLIDTAAVRKVLFDCTNKRGTGQDRARSKLDKLPGMQNVQVGTAGKTLVLSWLDLTDAGLVISDDPGEQQPHILVRVAVVSKQRLVSAFTFAAADHAVGRLIQRSAPGTDYAAAIMDAHFALMRASWDAFEAALDREQAFLLPAADGQFICEALFADSKDGGRPGLYARAVTWIAEDMRHDRQDVIELKGQPTGGLMLGTLLSWKGKPCRRSYHLLVPSGSAS
jgi:hypothetical protein